jgi:hypothetical protein
MGDSFTFLMLALVGLAATLAAAFIMPETKSPAHYPIGQS